MTCVLLQLITYFFSSQLNTVTNIHSFCVDDAVDHVSALNDVGSCTVQTGASHAAEESGQNVSVVRFGCEVKQ